TTITAGESFQYQFTASDPDGDPLTFSANGGRPNWLTLTESGMLYGTSHVSDAGTKIFNIRVTDDEGAYDQETFQITVLDPNSPPILDPFPLEAIASANNEFVYQVTATDPDGDPITFTHDGTIPDWLTLTPDGLLSGTSTADDIGTQTFGIYATDSGGYFDNEKFRITVVNDPPDINSFPELTTVTAGDTFAYQFTATDPNGDPVTFSASGNFPNWLTLTQEGLLSGTSHESDIGTRVFTIRATDDKGAFDEETFQMTVEGVPRNPPIITPVPDQVIDEDSPFSYQVIASDPEGDPLNFYGWELPNWVSVSPSGLISGTPTNNDVGMNSINIRVADGTGEEATDQFWVNVNNINDAPVMDQIPQATLDEDTFFSYQLTATDVDHLHTPGTLTYSMSNGPTWLSVNANGLLSGTPTDDDVGVNEFTVEVRDSAGA
ncbi:MAG: putative Ig domain-containing protein, partial [Actinomycetota bacterium]|nr:putative Ig domain-containing protein [Actinomycetota bacterium]